MSIAVFKVAVGFVVSLLILLAIALSMSEHYMVNQKRLAAAGDVDGALEDARLSARLDPFNGAPLVAESFLLRRQGQNDTAYEAVQEALSRDPNNYAYYMILGDLQIATLNDPEAAIQSYRKAVELSPKATLVISRLAEAQMRAGHLQDAAAEYENLMKLNGATFRDLYNLGRIYIRTGKPANGIALLQNAKQRARSEFQFLDPKQRAENLKAVDSAVDLAIVDGLVVQRKYAEARKMLENNPVEQADAILHLLNNDPEGYRERVLNSPL